MFISYFPMHDGNKVVGVLGLEFAADRQYAAFRTTIFVTSIVVLLSCLIAAAIAVLLFRRISNPSFRDMANTDFLTGLKNRNAFEVDLNNYDAETDKQDFMIVSADLNGLKTVNDTYGHEEGDAYIRLCAGLLQDCVPDSEQLYRIGGDEFVLLMPHTAPDAAEEMVRAVRAGEREANANGAYPIGLSIGWARYDADRDASLHDTLRRSDKEMYRCKKREEPDD